jgi:hypothetical protein
LIQQLNSAEPRLRRKFPIGRPIRHGVPRPAATPGPDDGYVFAAAAVRIVVAIAVVVAV